MEELEDQEPETRSDEALAVEELIPDADSAEQSEPAPSQDETALRAAIEALVYVAEEPLTVAHISNVLGQPAERIQELIGQVAAEFEKPEHGLSVREVAGGYKMATKAEHHETVRAFAKSLKPPLKLSLAALETLAVIAYKQPVTVPEIQEVRGVQGGGVVKTLLDRKLISMAGRKNVIGKPILYRTSKEFLIQFGLKDLSELPSLKEFEEIRRFAFSDAEASAETTAAEPEQSAAEQPSLPLAAASGEEVDTQPASVEPGEAPPTDSEPAPDAEVPQPEPDLSAATETVDTQEPEELGQPAAPAEPEAEPPAGKDQ
jgi:segregation and condensation protein B